MTKTGPRGRSHRRLLELQAPVLVFRVGLAIVESAAPLTSGTGSWHESAWVNPQQLLFYRVAYLRQEREVRV